MDDNKKLIRLHSTNEQGLFECEFNEEIQVNKNSQIALHSTIFKILNGSLDVTTGDIGTFEIKIEEPTDPDGEEYEFVLNIPAFEYTKLDVEDLLFQLNDETNEQITNYIEQDGSAAGEVGSYETLIRGREAFWNLDKEGKVQFRIKAQFMIQLSLATENVYKNMVFANGYFSKSDAVNSQNLNQNYSYSKLKFIKGVGCIRAQIFNFANAGDASANYMGIGLTQRDDKLKDGTITIEDLDFALYTGDLITDNYRSRILVEGTSTETISTIAPSSITGGSQNNDVMQIELVGNKFFFIIHKQNGVVHRLNNGVATTFDKTYHAVFFTAGTEANNRLADCRYNISPYQKISNSLLNNSIVFANPSGSLSTPRRSGTDPTSETAYFLDFKTIELSQFLGYNKLSYLVELTSTPTIKAETIFKHISHSNSYVIELLDIQLDSFDSISGGRRNILSIIPVADQILNSISGILRYEPNTPTYISLKNKERSYAIRNMKLRILTQDMEKIQTEGINFITVLLKNNSL